ncbi:MAG: enolase C-terminal domain-like protein [Candidatus Latescibacterota bacterium]
MNTKVRITQVETHRVIMPCKSLLQSGGGGRRVPSSFPTVAVPEDEAGKGLPGHAMERMYLVVHTDAGITGIGETWPMPPETFAPLIGQNPMNVENVHLLYRGEENHAWVAVEMACMDIVGKVLDLPLCKLLHGEDVRRHVPHSAYCFFRLPNSEGKGGVDPQSYVAHCQDLIETFGFGCLKLKMGVYHPDIEVELVAEVRKSVGPKVLIRMDVNGVWSQATAIRAMKKLEACDLEYMEDPLQSTQQHAIHDFRGMRELRRRTLTPIAVDGNYRIKNLVNVIRYDAADVVLGDYYGCNGIKGLGRFYDMAKAFNLGISMHSGYEMGVALMARAHVGAATPGMYHAIDMHYHQLTDDVIEGGLIPIRQGCVSLSDRPGLGVALDPERLERYRWTQEKHDENARVTAELKARYERIEHDSWVPEHGVFTEW